MKHTNNFLLPVISTIFTFLFLTAALFPTTAQAKEDEIPVVTVYALDPQWNDHPVKKSFDTSGLPVSYTLPDGEWSPYDTTMVAEVTGNVVQPILTTYYGYQNEQGYWIWQTWKDSVHNYTKEKQAYHFEDCLLSSDDGRKITLRIKDYAEYWAMQYMDRYLGEHIKDSMSQREQAEVCCRFVAENYDYGTSYSSFTGMILTGAGDCIASSDALLYMLQKLGIRCTMRDASSDDGAGTGHHNIAAKLDGHYFILDAGLAESKPRSFVIKEWSQPCNYRKNADGKTAVITYYANLDDNNRVEIPSEIDGYTITEIDEGCFRNDEEIEEILLPDTIKTIGAYAFANMKKLKYLDIPDSVETIFSYAFHFSDSVERISIGKGLKKMSNGAFVYMHGLKTLTVDPDNPYFSSSDNVLYNKDKTELILYPLAKSDSSYRMPDSVTKIRQWAFCDVALLKNLTLSENLTTIEKEAFYICDGPEELLLPESLTSLEPYSLSNCQISRIVLPKTMKSVCSHAFYQATPTSVTLPEGLERIENYAFANLLGAASFTMPKSLQYIGDYAFKPDLVNSYSHNPPMEYLRFPYDTEISFGKDILGSNNYFVILAKNNSSAHNYAMENNAPFAPLNEQGKLTLQDDWFSLSSPYTSYTGKETDPGIALNFDKLPFFLKKNRDYTITLKNAVEPGTATLTINGTDILEGSWSDTYTISAPYTDDNDNGGDKSDDDKSNKEETEQNNKKNNETTSKTKKPSVAATSGVALKNGAKKLILTWKKNKKVSGYQLQISRKKSFKGAKKIKLSASKKRYTFKKLKRQTKYYVRIRAYRLWKNAASKTKKSYGPWSTFYMKTR